MRVIFLATTLIIFLSSSLPAQLWDAAWVIGNDETLAKSGGGTLLDFKKGVLNTSFIPKRYHSDAANTSVCDKHGHLQFYTNGCVIGNRQHKVMENGEIHVGEYTDEFCGNGSLNYSSAAEQSVIALPNFQHDSLYFVISQRLDEVRVKDSSNVAGTQLYLNIVDMRANQGLGKVTAKHIEILNDTLDYTLQAVPHANGRDWWIITPKFRTNCYYVILLDAEGRTTVTKQCLGTTFAIDSWLGQSTFSPDGSKFVRFHWKYHLNLFDFDRCSGTLSNAQAITFPDITFFRAGCAFSPSSRYLYTTTHTKLFQFDMQAPDIATSRVHIADYDGFDKPFKTRFYMANLALDGKVYVGCPGQHKHIHVINEPELPGTACDFQQHSIELFTSNFWSFPNQPHSRLGPIDGSPCDSLGLDNHPWAWWWHKQDTSRQVVFQDLSSYEPTQWAWDFGDPASGAANQSNLRHPAHTFSQKGAYQVCLTASNVNGGDTHCRWLNIGPSSLEQPEAQGRIAVSPNPSPGTFQIQLPDNTAESFDLLVYDTAGKLRTQQRATGGTQPVQLPDHLPNGVYTLCVFRENGQLLGRGRIAVMR